LSFLALSAIELLPLPLLPHADRATPSSVAAAAAAIHDERIVTLSLFFVS